MKAARQLSSDDLVSVLASRHALDAQAKAAPKAKAKAAAKAAA